MVPVAHLLPDGEKVGGRDGVDAGDVGWGWLQVPAAHRRGWGPFAVNAADRVLER